MEKRKRNGWKLPLLLAAMLFVCTWGINVSAAGVDMLALGDSVTTGYGLSDQDECYVNLVASQKGFTFLNYAQDGLTSAELVTQLETAVQNPSLQTMVSDVEYVVLTIGGNDLLGALYEAAAQNAGCTREELLEKLQGGNAMEILSAVNSLKAVSGGLAQGGIDPVIAEYQKNLGTVIAGIRSLKPSVQIILQTQYHPYQWVQYDALSDVIQDVKTCVEKMNEATTQLAQTTGCTLVDVYEAFQKSQSSLTNASIDASNLMDIQVNLDFHPNSAGHEVIAELVAAAIQDKTPEPEPEPEPEPVKTLVQSVTLDYAQLRLFAGEQTGLKAQVLPGNADDSSLDFSSSNPSVASVDGNGKVTALAAGSATITASAKDGSGIKAFCTVTVVNPTVKLNVTSAKLQVKKSTKAITAGGLQEGDRVKSWKSSDKKIATVNKNGKITAKKTGKATITVTTEKGATASVKLTVTKKAVKTKSIKVNVKTATLKKGDRLKLTITRKPVTATDKITYQSSQKSVASVNKNGKITAKKKGKTNIVIRVAGKKRAVVKVTVK